MIRWKATFQAILAFRFWLALYWALLVVTIVWLFWPFLLGEVPAFRDAFHFYYPLEVWLATCAEAGQFMPHFNPLDGTGANLIGETSSGMYYPGRILWWIPGLTVAQRFGVVLTAHTLLAAAGAAYAARRMNLSPTAACLAATAYALSGAVLFQHTNPIYLIGAAWTPWLVAECWVLAQPAAAFDGRHRQGSLAAGDALHPRMCVWVAAAALMLLGGDPQATANSGIVTLVALATRLIETRSWRVFGKQLLWLACAVLLVSGLTAVQWVPARSWLKHSQRAVAQHAVDDNAEGQVADVPELLRPLAESLLHPSSNSTAVQVQTGGTYGFSIAPWHLLTLLWGTAGGHFLPAHTRWLQVWGAEPRMWVASLSIGLLPTLWVIAGWSDKSTRRRQRFLIIVAAVSGLAMLGNYAPVWLLRQVCHALGVDDWSRVLPSDEVGSAYWLLTKLVPGYSAFRYPAKWSIWFTCALALSAAGVFDRHGQTVRTWARLCIPVAVLSLAAALAVAWLHWMPGGEATYRVFSNWLATAPPDPWLGRPDAVAVMRLWLHAALVATAISASCAVCVRLTVRTGPMSALVLLLTLVELAWAGKMWLVPVDMQRLAPAAIATLTESRDASRVSTGRLFERLWAGVGQADWESWSIPLPAGVQTERERVASVCGYQSLFRLGKLHLLSPRQANLSGLMSLTPRSLTAARYLLARADDLRPDNPALDQALAWLGVSQRLTSDKHLLWQAVPDARPIVELVSQGLESDSAETGRCIVERFDVDRLRIHVSSQRDSQLIVRLLQDGGWSASLTPADAAAGQRPAVHRVPVSTHFGLFQTLAVPSGNWTIVLSYRAPGWQLGLITTLSTLIIAGFLVVATTKQRRGYLLRQAKTKS